MEQLEEVLSTVGVPLFTCIDHLPSLIVLNELNQYAHRLDEKPAQFKLADVCQPVRQIPNGPDR